MGVVDVAGFIVYCDGLIAGFSGVAPPANARLTTEEKALRSRIRHCEKVVLFSKILCRLTWWRTDIRIRVFGRLKKQLSDRCRTQKRTLPDVGEVSVFDSSSGESYKARLEIRQLLFPRSREVRCR